MSAALKNENPIVLLVILARNKAHVLPDFLSCINNIDYDKKWISVYINTNNNSDNTELLLKNWVDSYGKNYRSVIFEKHSVSDLKESNPHDWSVQRLKILSLIRNKSLGKAKENSCDYYFIVDCDNFVTPCTLKYLIAKNKPIISPMLKAIPEKEDYYSNFFCEVTSTGYYAHHPDYYQILASTKIGTFKVPLVHCTYLIQSSFLDKLTYVDGTDDFDFVIFSRSARRNHVDQYICNERSFGYLLHFHTDLTLEQEIDRIKDISITGLIKKISEENGDKGEVVFSRIYENGEWGKDAEGRGHSGQGSTIENNLEYAKFLVDFIQYNGIHSVLDVGCGDWAFSRFINWGKVRYIGMDVVNLIIERNNRLFASDNISFVLCDDKFTHMPMTDLLICKDVLQHLSNESVQLFLNQIHKFKHCLIVNDFQWGTNIPISTGEYRAVDLSMPPFNAKGAKIFTYRSGNMLKQVFYVNRGD